MAAASAESRPLAPLLLGGRVLIGLGLLVAAALVSQTSPLRDLPSQLTRATLAQDSHALAQAQAQELAQASAQEKAEGQEHGQGLALVRRALAARPRRAPVSPLRFLARPRGLKRRFLLRMPAKCDADPDAKMSVEDTEGPILPLHWSPLPERYLFPLCEYGRISNQLHCMRRYFHLAAVLNRTLIIPREGYASRPDWSYRWRWDAVFDLPRLHNCLASCCSASAPAVLSLQDFLERTGRPCINIDGIFALNKRIGRVNITNSHARLGLCPFNGTERVLPQERLLLRADLQELLKEAQGMEVVSMGSLYTENLADLDMGRSAAPFPTGSQCTDLWRPNRLVLSLAHDVRGRLIGTHGGFAAMHLRRGDFSHMKGDKSRPGSYMDMETIAAEVRRWIAPLQVPVLYVASDGAEEELEDLERRLQGINLGVPLRIVHLGMIAREVQKIPTAQEVMGMEIGNGQVVLAALEKYLCAHAKSFLGTPFSTFTQDIKRIRLVNGWASCRDADLWASGEASH